MINKAAIYHRPKNSFSYAFNKNNLHIRLKTAKNEINNVVLRLGDPYDWAHGGGGGNLNAEDAYGWVGVREYFMKKEAETEYFDYWFAEVSPKYKRSRYAFVLESDDEKLLYGEKEIVDLNEGIDKLDDLGNYFCFPFINEADVYDIPSWVKDTIWYQIFPERFSNGNPDINPENTLPWASQDPEYNSFFGGDIQGIINNLDYLHNLGINGIYLCPVFEAPSNHKYDTTDYFKVDKHFGDEETLKTLINEAHNRGIKIMLDAVFNHIGFYSKEWQDVLQNGENSKYKDWFHIRKFPVLEKDLSENITKDDINYDTFAFTPYMPKLNTNNPEVREFLLEVGRYWVRKFNIDAWRLDVANEVDHQFWREFRTEVKKIKQDIYILGEIWHDAMPWLQGDQFDSAMNYPLSDSINKFFAKKSISSRQFMYGVNNINVSYPVNVTETSFTLLDSHDTPRFLTQANEDKRIVKLAHLFQFTNAGTPCVYYGTEIGLSGAHDPLCRKCMIWEEEKQDKDMFDFMQRIIQLRKDNISFKSHELEWIYINDENKVIGFKKVSGLDVTYVLMNNADETINIELPNELKNTNKYEIFTNNEYNLQDKLELHPYDFKIFK